MMFTRTLANNFQILFFNAGISFDEYYERIFNHPDQRTLFLTLSVLADPDINFLSQEALDIILSFPPYFLPYFNHIVSLIQNRDLYKCPNINDLIAIFHELKNENFDVTSYMVILVSSLQQLKDRGRLNQDYFAELLTSPDINALTEAFTSILQETAPSNINHVLN